MGPMAFRKAIALLPVLLCGCAAVTRADQPAITVATPPLWSLPVTVSAVVLLVLAMSRLPARLRHLVGLLASIAAMWMAIAGFAFGFPEFDELHARDYTNVLVWYETFAVVIACLHVRTLQPQSLVIWLTSLAGIVVVCAGLEMAYWRLAWGAEYHILDRELLGYRSAPFALLMALALLWPSNGGSRWKIAKAARWAGCTLALGVVASLAFLVVRDAASSGAEVSDFYDVWEDCMYGALVVSTTLALAIASLAAPLASDKMQ